jgi:peptidoglycan hydrolase-like protein with peptidoglycan-binding domain
MLKLCGPIIEIKEKIMKMTFLTLSLSLLCIVGLTGCKTIQAINDDLATLNRSSSYSPPEPIVATSQPQPPTSKLIYYPPEMVKDVQSSLKEKGYAVSRPDGLFGPKTMTAVKSFQRDRGIPITGKLDERTVSMMGVRFNNNQHQRVPVTPTRQVSNVNKVVPKSVESSSIQLSEKGSPSTGQKTIRRMRVVETTDIKISADPFSSNVGSIRGGQTVDVLEQSGEWYKIKYNGKEGFVFSDFLK